MSLPQELPDPRTTEEVTVETVAALAGRIASGEIRLVDCREDAEWRFNRLSGAAHLPLSRFTTAAGPLATDRVPTIVYCHHGVRSLQAARWLRDRGLDACWSMTGGIDHWSVEIDPSVPRY